MTDYLSAMDLMEKPFATREGLRLYIQQRQNGTLPVALSVPLGDAGVVLLLLLVVFFIIVPLLIEHYRAMHREAQQDSLAEQRRITNGPPDHMIESLDQGFEPFEQTFDQFESADDHDEMAACQPHVGGLGSSLGHGGGSTGTPSTSHSAIGSNSARFAKVRSGEVTSGGAPCNGGAPGWSGSKECAVCLSTYEPGDALRVLPCLHRFHKDCLNRWIEHEAWSAEDQAQEASFASCPLCKRVFLVRRAAPG